MYREISKSKGWAGNTLLVLAAMVLISFPGKAQVTVGDNLNMNLSGNLGFGYNGSFGNFMPSNHATGLSGSGDLSGYYFHPNFLSFQVRPYYDRSQANADSQVISRGSGIGASMGLFSGSSFPGSISYGRAFSNDSEFLVAGIPSVTGDASGRNFNITWSELLPDKPTLTVSYSSGSTDASILDGGTSHNSSRHFNMNSSYQMAGFSLNGFFSHTNSAFETPAFLVGETIKSEGSGTNYGASAQHRMPLNGGFTFNWTHSSADNDRDSGYKSDSLTATHSARPWHKLSLYHTATYTTDVVGAFSQSISNDVATPLAESDPGSHSFLYSAGASFQVTRGLSITGHYNHRNQWLWDREYADTQYGGSINYNYASRLLGLLYVGFGAQDIATKEGNQGGGFNATVGMNRKFGSWDTSADFNYFQNVQTLIAVVNTSSYSYGASIRRRYSRQLAWSGTFRGTHSGLVRNEGSGNRAESFSTGVRFRNYNLTGSYSQSSGRAVFTSTGELTATPVAPLVTDFVTLFDAHSWSVTASTTLMRRVLLTAGYSRFSTRVTEAPGGVFNTGDRFVSRMEYRLRKFSFIGGFNRSMQDVSTLPGGPRMVNSYYLSLTRWFNVF